MGIRYYAYAFDGDMAEHALVDPEAFVPDYPLADAWGLAPGAVISSTTFEQVLPPTAGAGTRGSGRSLRTRCRALLAAEGRGMVYVIG